MLGVLFMALGWSEALPRRTGAALKRLLGVPWLFAVAYSAVGFSIYFSLGVVADRGLGLTPLIFLAAGLLFVLTTYTYVEGGAMFRERGGSSSFARHAFNELISFIAGWAILIDYIIVIAIAAITVPHYLTPISEAFDGLGRGDRDRGRGDRRWSRSLNVAGITGQARQRLLVVLALADLALQVVMIVVGYRGRVPGRPADRPARPLHVPTLTDVIYAAVIATVASPGSRPPPTSRPTSSGGRATCGGSSTAGALLMPMLYTAMAADGADRGPGGAGPRRPRDRARRAATSRSRCSASSRASTRPGSATRCSGRWSSSRRRS